MYGNGYGMDSTGVGVTALLLPVIIISIVSFVVSILLLVSFVKIYSKAGEKWWKALIPIYNILVLMKIVGMDYKQLLFILIPFVGALIFSIKLCLALAKRFEKSSGFAIGLILVPVIFIPLLAFSKGNIVKTETENVTNENTITESESTQITDLNDANNINYINDLNIVNTVNTITDTNTSITNNTIDFSNENISNDTIDMNTVVSQQTVMPLETEPVIVQTEIETLDVIDNNVSSPNIETYNQIIENNITANFEQIDINQISDANISLETEPVETLEVVETIIEPSNIETYSPDIETNTGVVESINSATTGNICKNCGASMPSIVTICPKCGTDNE